MSTHGLDTQTLLTIVYDIYCSTTDYDERRNYYKNKYPEFVNTYSYVFEMLCKPRFNFDKFIEITYNLSNSYNKRKRNDDAYDAYYTYDKIILPELLVPKLNNLFKEQQNAEEYFV